MSLRTFNNAASIVTGAASGIGRALAKELARRGAEVFLADTQIRQASELEAALRARGYHAHSFEVDVRNQVEVDALIENATAVAGRLDYVFNNAGIGIGGPIAMHSLDDWGLITSANLLSVVHGVQSALPVMRRQGFGHIVNTSSLMGLIPLPGWAAYSATKHAVVGLSTSLRGEVTGLGIRVSVLCPGYVRTPILVGGGTYGKLYFDLTPAEQLAIVKRYRPMDPDRFAAQALNAVARNSSIIVIPSWWKLLWWAYRVSPSLVMALMKRAVERYLETEGLQ